MGEKVLLKEEECPHTFITIQETIWQVEWIRDNDRERRRRKILIRKSRTMRFHILERTRFFKLCLAVHLCEKIVRAMLRGSQKSFHFAWQSHFIAHFMAFWDVIGGTTWSELLHTTSEKIRCGRAAL